MWNKKKLGELCLIKSGDSNARDADENGKYVLFDRSKKIKKSKRFLFDCEALIIPGEGKEFLPRYYKGKFDLHQRAYAIHQFKPELNIQYLFYYLVYNKDYFSKVAVGATVKSLRQRHFDNLEVYYPTLSEQQRIVSKLDAAFIEIDKSIIILNNKKDEIKKLVESIFNNKLNHVGKIKKINDLCTNITDGSHFSPKTVSKGYPYITVRDIVNDKINFSKCRYVNNKDFDKLKKNGCSPEKEDLLFSKDGTVGKVAIVENNNEFVVLSSLAILRCNTSLIVPEYLFLVLKSPKFLFKAVSKKTGVAIKRIILKNLKNIEISLPSLEEQKIIIKKLNKLMKENKNIIEAIEKQLNLLEILKISMLKSLINTDKLAA